MKYFLKTKKTEGQAPLFFEINKRTPKIKIQVCTNVFVTVSAWSTAQESARSLQRYTTSREGQRVMSLLSQIETAVINLFAEDMVHSSDDRQLIEDTVNSIAFRDERLRAEEERLRQEQERAEQNNRYKDILYFITDYLRNMEEGTVMNSQGRRYNENEILRHRAFCSHVCEYMETRSERTWDDITPTFANGFRQYLNSKKYMLSTVSSYLGLMRTYCRLASKYGYNSNLISLQVWNISTPTRDDKKTAVYLTEDELSALYDFPLLGNRAIIRDIFFIGSMIAQRWGDYSRLEKSMFSTVGGVVFLALTQQKTRKEVVIPITDGRVIRTLEKYDYTLPKMSRRHFSLRVQEICRELSEHVPSMAEEYETQPTKWEKENTPELINEEGTIVKKKWELIASHTARRAGVTNMYKDGTLDAREMMSITGHSSPKIFEDYIKLGAMEQAKRIAEKLKTKTQVKEYKTSVKK